MLTEHANVIEKPVVKVFPKYSCHGMKEMKEKT